MLDGSLVPFCSKCLVACMRANDILKSFEIRLSSRADWVTADSPHHRGGQSAPVPESLQCLWWARGRSGPGERTVRHYTSIVYQKGCLSGVRFKVERRTVRPWGADGPPTNLRFVPDRLFLWFGLLSELRTVRPWGADGPPANLRFVPERLFLWFGLKSELRTVRPWGADGPPLGCGQSAG